MGALPTCNMLFLKIVQQREKWVDNSKSDVLWGRAHKRNARRVLNVIVVLEGLWVKLGQYMSTRADVLPEEYICLLKQLQDSLPPRPVHEVILSTVFWNWHYVINTNCPLDVSFCIIILIVINIIWTSRFVQQ